MLLALQVVAVGRVVMAARLEVPARLVGCVEDDAQRQLPQRVADRGRVGNDGDLHVEGALGGRGVGTQAAHYLSGKHWHMVVAGPGGRAAMHQGEEGGADGDE